MEHPMTKTKVVCRVVGMVMLSFCAISIGAAQDDFSGIWVLDKEKTRDLPPGLASYTMVVTQNAQQLVVETKLEGDFRPPEGGPGEGPPESGGPPPGGPGDEGLGGPEGGPPPGGPGGGPPGGGMALRMVIPKATYLLDGEQTTAQVESPRPGTVKLKAKWAKDKKTLELSSVREIEFWGSSVTFTSKERWTLSDGGELLKVQRSVDTPRGTDAVKLTFRKGQGEPQRPQQ
jgi:hypothetical protein